MEFNLKHSKHAVGQNCYHLVWKPKYSVPIFNSTTYRKVCEGAIRQVAINYGLDIHELQVMKDHVHLFVDLPPTMPVSKALQLFKGISSRMLRRQFSFLRKHKHLWSPGKFFRSVGNVTSDVIQNYIKYSRGHYHIPDSKLPAYYRQQKLNTFV